MGGMGGWNEKNKLVHGHRSTRIRSTRIVTR